DDGDVRPDRRRRRDRPDPHVGLPGLAALARLPPPPDRDLPVQADRASQLGLELFLLRPPGPPPGEGVGTRRGSRREAGPEAKLERPTSPVCPRACAPAKEEATFNLGSSVVRRYLPYLRPYWRLVAISGASGLASL